MSVSIADRLIEAIKAGRIVVISGKRVKDVKVETTRRGARVVRVIFEDGEERVMYESHLTTRSIQII